MTECSGAIVCPGTLRGGAYQSRHFPRVEEPRDAAEEVEGDLPVMVALHAVCEILQYPPIGLTSSRYGAALMQSTATQIAVLTIPDERYKAQCCARCASMSVTD